jgi:hypothetical protein
MTEIINDAHATYTRRIHNGYLRAYEEYAKVCFGMTKNSQCSKDIYKNVFRRYVALLPPFEIDLSVGNNTERYFTYCKDNGIIVDFYIDETWEHCINTDLFIKAITSEKKDESMFSKVFRNLLGF